MKLTKLLLAATLAVSSVSMAATPTDAQIAQLAKVAGIHELIDSSFVQGFSAPIKANLANHPNYAKLSAKDKQKLDMAVDNFANKVMKDFNDPKLQMAMLDAFKQANKKYYSDKEVQAMIDFYSTPIGKAIVAKQIPVMNEFMQEMMAKMSDPKMMEQMMMSSAKHSIDFEGQVDAILGDTN